MNRIKKKECCEICGSTNKSSIDYHHIIPRTDPRSTDKLGNLAIICANCHRRVHANEIIIEGVYQTTAGQKLFWHYAGDPYVIRPGVFLLENGLADIKESE